MSTADLADRGGGKGKLVEVLHVYGDCLWGLCNDASSVPNSGALYCL